MYYADAITGRVQKVDTLHVDPTSVTFRKPMAEGRTITVTRPYKGDRHILSKSHGECVEWLRDYHKRTLAKHVNQYVTAGNRLEAARRALKTFERNYPTIKETDNG